MQDIFPKVNQVFSYHLKNFDVINALMSSISLRVQAQEQYQKAITKSVQKINEIQTDHPLYSKIINSFKGLISERIHQVRFFKEQIAKQAEVLKNALLPIEAEMKNQLSNLKSMEKDLRTSFDALTKSKAAVDSKYKQLDEKFILNEVSALYKMNKNLRKTSQVIVRQQYQLLKALDSDWDKFRQGLTYFQAGAQEKQKKIWQLDIKVEEQFVDFFKKLNVHEISLIRNIQYDIDNMIKKTDIFNWTNTSEFKDRFNLKGNEQVSLQYNDPYSSFKISILKQQEVISPKSELICDQVRLSMLKQKLSDPKEAEEVLKEIKASYQHYKVEIYEYIESFRKVGHFKFDVQPFKLLIYVFKEILKAAMEDSVDFQCVYKLVIYSNSYYCQNYLNYKKRTVLEEIKGEKQFGDIIFWKFFLLYNIRAAIINAQNYKQQKQVHIRSGVYSALLSNSLTMVECGLQKHNIKNLVGKIAKTFASLPQSQVAQLFKVIESAHENLQKIKKK